MSKVNSSEYDNIDPGFLVGGASRASYELGGSSSATNSNNYGYTTLPAGGNSSVNDNKFILAKASENPNNGYNSVKGDKFILAKASENSNIDANTNSNNYGFTTLRPEDANNNYGYSGVDGDMFVSSEGNGNSESDYGYTTLPNYGGTPAYGSQGSSGVVSMNPKALYNTALNGVDLESRVNANFQHLDDVFEELIQSVQTPELNSRLKSLYETFRKVENDFDKNNQVINKFFEGQLQSYSEHAETISEAVGNLSQNSGSSSNSSNDKVMPISGNIGHLTKDIWPTDPGAYRGSDKIGNSLGDVNSGKSGIVDIQPVKPVVEVQGSSSSSNLGPTKVYTYDETNGLREATNVGHKSDYDLIHDTAFGVNPNGSSSSSSNGSSDSSSWTAYDGNKMAR